jgi:hypothetical protein
VRPMREPSIASRKTRRKWDLCIRRRNLRSQARVQDRAHEIPGSRKASLLDTESRSRRDSRSFRPPSRPTTTTRLPVKADRIATTNYAGLRAHEEGAGGGGRKGLILREEAVGHRWSANIVPRCMRDTRQTRRRQREGDKMPPTFSFLFLPLFLRPRPHQPLPQSKFFTRAKLIKQTLTHT